MIMNIFDFTPEQLKRAASIKQQIAGLNKQLRGILGAPATPRARQTRNRDYECFCQKEDCGYSKSKWAKVRASKPATASAKLAARKTVIKEQKEERKAGL